MNPLLAPLLFALGVGLGVIVGWGVFAPERRWFRAPDPPPPPPPAGLAFAGQAVAERFAPRCREAAQATVAAALGESGADPITAEARAQESGAARLGEAIVLGLVQAGWVDGASSLSDAVRASSPLPPAITERLLDLGYAAAITPMPEPEHH